MDVFISSAEEAFLHVGSMIGFFILLFGYINYKTNGNFTYIISKNKKLQPLIGGLIGSIPGCGGTLAIMPLYIQKKLSFGAIVASLISSMGDAAFILIASNFKLYIFVTVTGLITGVITGYIVDLFNLEIKLNLKSPKSKTLVRGSLASNSYNKYDELDRVAHHHGNINKFAYIITHGVGYKLYIFILLIGFVFMTIAHSGINSSIVEKIHSIEELIAILGIVSSVVYMMCFKKVFKNSNSEEEENKKSSLKEVLIHSVGEISFVITWIFIAYIIYDLSVILIGGEKYISNFVLYTGIGSVLIGALLGLIPGCGVQIVLLSFYLKGNVPLGAVIANSISQDGDALFPLIAMDKKSALWATILTTIPALVVGVIVYIISV
jgi:hypothetical protein